MIKLKKITKIYKEKSLNPVKALKEISISFPDTGMVFIVGKSGSGKSTLLNVIGGIDSPTSGEIIFNDVSFNDFSENDNDLNVYRNKFVGFVFQEYNLLPNYNVGDNIAIALELQNKKSDKDTIDKLLIDLDLVDDNNETLYKRNIKELSGGQKQRVAIARALIKNPQIILADEPTGALDAETSENFYKLLKKISKDRLVLIVSHDIENANKFGDRIVCLSGGTIKSDSIFSNGQEDTSIENLSKSKDVCFKKEKSHLPFLKVIKMALSALIVKPFRLVLSTLISLITCSLFCFSLVVSTTDLVTAELKSCYANGALSAILVQKSNVETVIDHKDGTKDFYSSDEETSLSDRQFEMLENKENFNILKAGAAVLIADRFGYNNFSRELTDNEYYNPYNYLAAGGFSRLVEINKESDAYLVRDERLSEGKCKLPSNQNEIAITDYWADMFLRFGYKDYESNEIVKISSIDELIGKKLEKDFVICGIYKTDESQEFLKKYDHDAVNNSLPDDYLFMYLRGEHSMNYGFVCNGFFEKNIPSPVCLDVYYKLKGNLASDKQILSYLTYSYEETFTNGRPNDWVNYYTHNVSATFKTRYSGFDMATDTLRSKECVKVLLIVSSVLAVLSALILFNFLNASLDEKKHEFGILRALGARKLDITRIFLSEVGITMIVNFLVSTIVTSLACLILNNQYDFWLFNVGFIPILALFGVCVFVAALGSILPSIQLGKKKPVDIIRDNQTL